MPVADLTPMCKTYQKKLKALERDLKDAMNDRIGSGDLRVDLKDLLSENSVSQKNENRRRRRRKNKPDVIPEEDYESQSSV